MFLVRILCEGLVHLKSLLSEGCTSFYPHAFFKKSEEDIVIASVRLSVRLSVRYAISSKLLDEIQPNLVCELLS